MSKKELKTNAMRMLDREKIPYTYETYDCGGIHRRDPRGGSAWPSPTGRCTRRW